MSLGGGARSPQGAASRGVDDRGVFILSLAGRQIGTENFSIRSSRDQIEAKAQIQLRLGQDGNTVELKVFPDLLMNSRFEPLTYSWSQRGAQSSELAIDFRNSPAKCRYHTVTGQEDKRDFDLPRDVVVLDDNVLHHYELVVSRLNLPAGGQQTFKAFVPQEALPGVLTVEEVRGSSPGGGEHAERLRHLRVTTELTRIDLWVDEQHRLQRVSNPETQFEAVRRR
jgi:hypothetical protein